MGYNILFAQTFVRPLDQSFHPEAPARRAAIEKVHHVRGKFSGPQRPTDTYWTFTGTDDTKPRVCTLPPGTPSVSQVIEYAVEYLWHDADAFEVELALERTTAAWKVLNRIVPRPHDQLDLFNLYIAGLSRLLVQRRRAS